MPKQDEDFSLNNHPEQDHIDEMIEYQNNQLNPGYYVGTGRIPPAIKASGNAMPLAIWMFIQAACLILFYCILVKFLFFHDDTVTVAFSVGSPLFNFIVITVIFLGAAFVCIWFGIIYLKKAKSYRLQHKQFKESDSSDDINGENQMMQRTCPACGKEHDIDYPKCPYCKHSYIAK